MVKWAYAAGLKPSEVPPVAASRPATRTGLFFLQECKERGAGWSAPPIGTEASTPVHKPLGENFDITIYLHFACAQPKDEDLHTSSNSTDYWFPIARLTPLFSRILNG